MPSKQASPRGGEGRSVAERMAREIIPQWTNASAANTMEYENALGTRMAAARYRNADGKLLVDITSA